MAGHDAWHFAVTVPAGTPIGAPLVTLTQIPLRRLTEVRWRIPPGAVGVVGFAISSRTVQVIPKNIGAFIVDDGRAGSWELEDLPESGDWSVTAYNTGAFPHTIQITFIGRVVVREPEPLRIIDNDDISFWPTFIPVRDG